MSRFRKLKGLERIIGIPIVGVLVPLITGDASKGANLLESILISIIYTFFLWQGNWYIVRSMRQRFPGYQDTPRRLSYQLIFALIYTTVAALALATGIDALKGHTLQFPPQPSYLPLCYTVTIFITSIYESVYFFERWKEVLLESEKLKRDNLQSRFETLKTQVSPHFLFNSLNTLITLIPEDAERAVEFVQKLSEVYRYILQTKDKEVVPLQQEIEFATSYLFLMKMRFSENLQVRWAVPPKYKHLYLPPLALQMLLENAIKHNIVSTQKPLTIEIYTETGETIIVKNNLQLKSARAAHENNSTKIGLQNISNRYSYLTERQIDVIVTTHSYLVALPLLQVSESRKSTVVAID